MVKEDEEKTSKNMTPKEWMEFIKNVKDEPE
jgi:hypothetical protein